jgi:flagellar basal-body rod modification protein FlgD
MSLATISAQQNAALAAAATAAANPAASASAMPATTTARTTLAGNFDNFLKLLMTQLKNQDPTSPLDTNQFTTQLVQFSSVEQQINANANLTKLIELTQGEQVLQASALVGKHVAISADHIPLQGGTGEVDFNAATARPVAITITNDAGARVRDAVISANAGDNRWAWDGRNNAGNQMPDGSYRIAVIGANPDGTVAAQPFTVQGVATGMSRQGNNVSLRLGSQTADFSAVQQVLP